MTEIAPSPITPDWLFQKANLTAAGSVAWGVRVPETGPGVYVVTIADPPVGIQFIVYIGRSKHLSKRLRQFYHHKYGAPSPHRGGQEILPLTSPKTVHWAPVTNYHEAKRVMLNEFRASTGAFPYGNRINSARAPSAVKEIEA